MDVPEIMRRYDWIQLWDRFKSRAVMNRHKVRQVQVTGGNESSQSETGSSHGR
jgi:hypothetical protein